MQVVSDLHLHSKFSRAVSRDMTLPVMAQTAKRKGINLITASDFTHPVWFKIIKEMLKETGEGVYSISSEPDTKFVLSVEVSSIYSQNGKTRRVHSLLFSPSLEVAERINKELVKRGCNISSDGRPIVGLTPQNILEIMGSIDGGCFMIPCHVWTPWFSLYGSMSGFDSIEECFGKYKDQIFAIETGLSSDPAMNWRIKELENRSIVSFSDSHSPMKMGREATVFEMPKITFENLRRALMAQGDKKIRDSKVSYTIEFYPEEGKYHYTGHRNCKVVYSPKDTKEKGTICPVCKRNLTVGVMERVEKLAFRDEEVKQLVGGSGISWSVDPGKKHPPYAKLVSLARIIAESLDTTPASLRVKELYDSLCSKFGTELDVLMKVSIENLERSAGEKIADGIKRVREGDIFINPGFDGEYGLVRIYMGSEEKQKTPEQSQLI
jgi:uncharacterized protein (TIGR00375 family)